MVGALLGILRLIQYLYHLNVRASFYIWIALAFVFMAYSVFLSLRRLIDMGFGPWNKAFYIHYLSGAVFYQLSVAGPLSGKGFLGAYYLLTLLIPTAPALKEKAATSVQIE